MTSSRTHVLPDDAHRLPRVVAVAVAGDLASRLVERSYSSSATPLCLIFRNKDSARHATRAGECSSAARSGERARYPRKSFPPISSSRVLFPNAPLQFRDPPCLLGVQCPRNRLSVTLCSRQVSTTERSPGSDANPISNFCFDMSRRYLRCSLNPILSVRRPVDPEPACGRSLSRVAPSGMPGNKKSAACQHRTGERAEQILSRPFTRTRFGGAHWCMAAAAGGTDADRGTLGCRCEILRFHARR